MSEEKPLYKPSEKIEESKEPMNKTGRLLENEIMESALLGSKPKPKSKKDRELEEAKAQGDINNLPPDLKAVADDYRKKENTPETALRMAGAQRDINNLPPNLKEVADIFSDRRYYSPETALKIAGGAAWMNREEALKAARNLEAAFKRDRKNAGLPD